MFEWIQRELIEGGNNPVAFWIAKKNWCPIWASNAF
jgi:hypothetical protein